MLKEIQERLNTQDNSSAASFKLRATKKPAKKSELVELARTPTNYKGKSELPNFIEVETQQEANSINMNIYRFETFSETKGKYIFIKRARNNE